jgi:hypothetical protein
VNRNDGSAGVHGDGSTSIEHADPFSRLYGGGGFAGNGPGLKPARLLDHGAML